jgi:hypothetical protein
MRESLGGGGVKIHEEQGDAGGSADFLSGLSSSTCAPSSGDAETGDAEMAESFGGGGKQNQMELGNAGGAADYLLALLMRAQVGSAGGGQEEM